MNKNTASITLLLLLSSLFFGACGGGATQFERAEDLRRYLLKEQGIDLAKKQKAQVVILQVGNCGACTQNVLQFLDEKIPKWSDSTYLFLAHEDAELMARLADLPNSRVVADKNNMISRYGLRYLNDLLFLVENGDIKHYFKLDESGIRRAARY